MNEPQAGPLDAAGVVPAVYASLISIAGNPSEMSLIFGAVRQIMSVGPAGYVANAVAEWIIDVHLPPVAAKTLLKALEAAIAAHETRFGSIQLDPSMNIQIGPDQVIK